MKTKRKVLTAALLALSVAALDASAKPRKPPPPPLLKADASTAVVSIIRRSVLLGDGWNYDVWDGEAYVGVLGAGRMLQYRAAPGEHLFLLMARGSHDWFFMKANLLAGREYFARAYPIPFALEATDAHSDERVDEWSTMTVDVPLSDEKKSKVVAKNLHEARGAITAFVAGDVPMDCGWWHPPNKKGQPSKPPSRSTGCRSVGDMKPDFGR